MSAADPDLPRRVAKRLFRQGWIANGVGVAVVFMAIGFLLAVFFDASERDELGRENLIVVIGFTILAGLLANHIFGARIRSALRWLREGREPTEEETRAALRLPHFIAMLTASGWFGGGIVFALLNLDHAFGAAAVICGAVWLGGETTSALAYLLSERTLRPVTEIVLQSRRPESSVALGVRPRMLFAWSIGTGVPILGLLVVGVVGISKPDADPENVAAACLFLGTVALGVGMLVTIVTARAIADPLTAMREAVDRVGRGDLDVHVAIDDSSEVGMLQAGVNRMADGLRERERIRDLFGRQVGEDVARTALEGGTRLGGEEREIGAVFVDLEGSTSMALAMPPTEVVALLNRFFRVVIDAVEAAGGMVNKFEGDAALCVFGAPAPCEDPAGRALGAARELAGRLEREVPEVGFGIGVSAGRAVAGNVGSERRFEYTVIGDPVNEAARLCEIAKERPERVIASHSAVDRCAGGASGEAGYWEVGERTILRGRIDATGLASPSAKRVRDAERL